MAKRQHDDQPNFVLSDVYIIHFVHSDEFNGLSIYNDLVITP